MNSGFTAPSEAETTGRFIVTFREEASTEAIATLENLAGVRSADLLRSGDFAESGLTWTRFLPKEEPFWAISAWP